MLVLHIKIMVGLKISDIRDVSIFLLQCLGKKNEKSKWVDDFLLLQNYVPPPLPP